jgi:hypothetical protein
MINESGRAISEYIDFPDFPDHFSQMPEPSFKVGLRSTTVQASSMTNLEITPALARNS